MKTNDSKEKAGKLPVIKGVAKETIELAAVLKWNTGIRRNTAKVYIDKLIAKGIAKAEDSIFVEFNWDKFKVVINGLGQDHWYSEEDLLQSLVESFGKFAKETENTISAYVNSLPTK